MKAVAATLRETAVVAAIGLIVATALPTHGAEQSTLEYQVKAGFCYKFLFFTEWPDAAVPELSDAPLILGIVGDNPFGEAFDEIVGEKIDGHPLEVAFLGEDATDEELRRCHLLFISPSLDERVEDLLDRLAGAPVVTVSDVEDFGERGGMVEFVIRRQRVRFAINTSAAEEAGIRFRSRLLRLADRIIGDDGEPNNGR